MWCTTYRCWEASHEAVREVGDVQTLQDQRNGKYEESQVPGGGRTAEEHDHVGVCTPPLKLLNCWRRHCPNGGLQYVSGPCISLAMHEISCE